MKALALIPIAGALTLFGSAFTGIWTPPGLEGVPTYADVLDHTPWGDSAEEEENPESGVFPLVESQQFLPHGVSGDHGDAPILELPKQVQLELDSETADPWSGPRPASFIRHKPLPKTILPTEPTWPVMKSYRLEGNETRFRNPGDGRL